MNVYYLAEIGSVVDRSRALPVAFDVRPVTENDIPALGEAFLRAYGPPIAGSLEEAVAEVRSVLSGAWGVLWPEASPVAWTGETVAGAVLSVRRPSWKDAPDLPWLTDVFTDPRYQRAGIARGLVGTACRAMQAAAEPRVGLTVEVANTAALALYKSLGFTEMA